MAGYEGFAALGDVLTGGVGRRAESSYHKGVKESADSFRALENARKARAQAMAASMQTDSRGKLTPELIARVQAGDQSALAELGAASLSMASGQPNLKALGDMADEGIRHQRQDALKAGNVPLYNQLTALGEEKNYEPVREVGGNLIPSGVALGDEAFQVDPLPQTKATIGLRNAQKVRAERPPTVRAPTTKTRSAEDEELANAREAMQAGIPRAKVIEKMRLRGFGNLSKKL